jgi:hypothetical protein
LTFAHPRRAIGAGIGEVFGVEALTISARAELE